MSSDKGSLRVVGTGIHLNHLTIETQDYIEGADKVFYLVADPHTATWLMRLGSKAESLQSCYANGKDRGISYREMTARIMESVRAGVKVCAVFYGHPAFLVTAAHAAIRQARDEGFDAAMCPAISAEDCLFSDLGIEPGKGCQSFEATDFLLRSRIFDPTCSLILFQIGIIGDFTCNPEKSDHPGLTVLVEQLRHYYPAGHPVVLYEAAQTPYANPVIIECTLSTIDYSRVKLITTLYVFPLPLREVDPDMMIKLGIKPKGH